METSSPQPKLDIYQERIAAATQASGGNLKVLAQTRERNLQIHRFLDALAKKSDEEVSD